MSIQTPFLFLPVSLHLPGYSIRSLYLDNKATPNSFLQILACIYKPSEVVGMILSIDWRISYRQKKIVPQTRDDYLLTQFIFTCYDACISLIFSLILVSISFDSSGLSINRFFTASRPWPSLSLL
jgi:hypothetical protein